MGFSMQEEMITRISSRILFPFMLVFGIYVILHGHLTSGGAFPGGVIVASAFALLAITHGLHKLVKQIHESEVFESIAGVFLVFIIFFEFFFRGVLIESGMSDVLILNVLGSIMVGAAFVIIILSLVRR